MKNQGLTLPPRRARLRGVAIQVAAFVGSAVAGVTVEEGAKWIASVLWHHLRALL